MPRWLIPLAFFIALLSLVFDGRGRKTQEVDDV